MTITLDLYDDPDLLVPATVPLRFDQDTLGTITPHQREFYLGCPDTGYRFQANSDPGVDEITLSIVDSVPATGQPATAIKLATSQGGLSSAVAGAALDLGATLLSGSANAVEIWVEFNDSTAVVATDTNIELALNTLRVDIP